ncbi:hypothetical protein [Lelliottia amnigena]
MASISLKKADNEALDILNRVIGEKRSISEFERAKVVMYLDSLFKANSPVYDEISACYFSQIADIDNLLISVSNAFERRDESSYYNLIYALNNSMRYKEAYRYIKEFDLLYDDRDFLVSAIKSCSFCADIESSNTYMHKYLSLYNDDMAFDFESHVSEFNDFIVRNKKIKKELSNYLLDCFDVFSRNTLSKTKDLDGSYGYSHHVFSDEGYEFLAFSFILNGSEDDMDYLIDIEDEFTSEIAKIKYDSIIKTKISFNFELGDLS